MKKPYLDENQRWILNQHRTGQPNVIGSNIEFCLMFLKTIRLITKFFKS